jgi:ribonuclease HI
MRPVGGGRIIGEAGPLAALRPPDGSGAGRAVAPSDFPLPLQYVPAPSDTAADAVPESSASERWQLWFDGCAQPNPGRLGLGALLLSPAGERIELSLPGARSGCNNEAEVGALCAALEHAHAAGARHLQVRGDSDFAVRHLRGEQRTAVMALQTLVGRARDLLSHFDSVDLQWVPRHRNLDADRLSRAALGLPAKPAPVPGHGKPKRRPRVAPRARRPD